jgi:hypothetical protein
MTYAVPPPAAGPPPSRPVSVTLCAALLGAMGLAGLGYAVATLAVTPGVVQRFRAAAAGADRADVDGFVTVLWVGAAVAAVLGVILFALYVVLALGLRHGSNAARIGGWVVAGLGLLAGCVTTVTVLIERSGAATPGRLGTALAGAYPTGWIGLNLAIAIAQMAGYVTVGLLLLLSPGAFFRRPAGSRPRAAGPPAYGPPPADDPPAMGVRLSRSGATLGHRIPGRAMPAH